MARATTAKRARRSSMTRKTEEFLAKQPELRDAMQLFDVSIKQYAQALSHLNRPQIVTTSSSTSV